jgi:hypothetical protein
MLSGAAAGGGIRVQIADIHGNLPALETMLGELVETPVGTPDR